MQALFHHDVVVAVLGSGSKGNCTYVGDGRHGVLIDCGISRRQVVRRLEAVGLPDAPIDGVLITHEHTDHVGAAGVLSRWLTRRTGRHVPFFMTRGTERFLYERVRPERVERIRSGMSFSVGPLVVEPYTVPHDTSDPVAYVVAVGPVRVGVLTDLGRVTRLVEQKVSSLDVAVVEFNHDVEMLIEGSYPWHLKQRIRGRHGHLSNDEASDLLATATSRGRLREVVLAHLSDENNSEERALLAAHRGLRRAGRKVKVHVARQKEPVGPYRVQAPVEAPGKRPRAPRRERSRSPVIGQLGLFGG